MTKRFELKTNFLNGQAGIVDWVKSKQKDTICVFNNLGTLPFSSASSVCDLLNQFNDENKQLKKENLDLSEELDYYKAKCASLETGLFQADKENRQLKIENNSLKLLVQNWEALDEEKDEQLDRQNQSLKKLVKENAQLKQLINDKEVEWLRNNTVWEQMPTSKRTITKTTFGDKND